MWSRRRRQYSPSSARLPQCRSRDVLGVRRRMTADRSGSKRRAESDPGRSGPRSRRAASDGGPPRVLRRAIAAALPGAMAPGASSSAPVVARYLLRVAYDGKNFHGFQRQAKARTVQGCVEAALARFGRAPGEVRWPRRPRRANRANHGPSRTDAGVHALDATAHVDIARERRRTSEPTSSPRPRTRAVGEERAEPLPEAPGCEDVRVEACVRVCPRTFHARFCATARTYRYRVRVAEAPPPVHEIGRVWHLATERVAGGGRARRGKVPEKHRTERTERTETNRKSVLRVRDVVTRMRLAAEAPRAPTWTSPPSAPPGARRRAPYGR